MASLLDRLFPPVIVERGISSWEESANEMTRLTMEDLYGLDVSGIADITRGQAMQVASVAKIRNRICAKIGGFPIQVRKGAKLYEYAPDWVTNLEDGRARFVSMSWLVDSLIFWGRAWLLVTKRGAGNVPQRFKFVPMWQAGEKNGQLTSAFGQRINPADAVRIEAHHEGLLNYGQDVLKRAVLIESAAQRAAGNPVPSIDLHQTGGTQLSNEEIDTLIERWAKARAGKNGGIGYTNETIEAKTMGQAPEQLLIAGRNLAAVDVARSMGAPAWSVDATTNGSNITYGNIESRSRELVEDTLEPYMEAIAGRLSLDDVLPRGVWARLDASNLLRESYSSRMNGHKTAIEANIYTVEEIKQLESGIPLESE